MKLKKKLRDFFTLTRKANGGFTLVELIVVIAIMGVLAGVGTVGYSGYVKNSQKKADMVLVGNIVRAIETGTNSTMFVPKDSIAVSATTYPVGFVALTKDGCQVLTSSSTFTAGTLEGDCHFDNVYVYTFSPGDISYNCTAANDSFEKDGYTYTVKQYYCCMTHSDLTAVAKDAYMSDFPIGFTHAPNGDCKPKSGCLSFAECGGEGTFSYLAAQYDKSYYTVDKFKIYEASSDGVNCKFAYAMESGTFTELGSSAVINKTSDPLYEAIDIAFGDVSGLKLGYDKWVSDGEDEFAYAPLYSYAPTMMSNVKTLTNLLATMDSLMLGSDKYNDGSEVLTVYADAFVKRFPNEQAFVDVWKRAPSTNDILYPFDMDFDGNNEYYMATRMLYNSCFVSYLQANGVTDEDTLETITFYGEGFDFLGQSYRVPRTICEASFGTTNNFDLGNLLDATTLGTVKDLYAKYIKSSIFVENAKVAYATLVTVNDTSAAAQKEGDGNVNKYFNYYNNYLQEMATLYTDAKTASANGILIIVTVEDDIVRCDVSPTTADPRNKT